ncbi:PREDICTED: LOW QUALITY PROTEIN: Gilles de la Tourette syndrome chromosomal region candidate gene 1 protein [Cercocebus atys]|uniref:LOW QUALITY PROTEIN: Gilles de la Tourette syndrome chromosomal region candidate gene 1 protein n=1 Tax=Cercocebus atys TaxID=9531 RepID=UPI0005F589C4|nr:PREDICTED: LOW QUALITY PROTEIN: Gilles de la Tourette syndrome chromosomal region candidate gene 1 protein [Cercocebus atys]
MPHFSGGRNCCESTGPQAGEEDRHKMVYKIEPSLNYINATQFTVPSLLCQIRKTHQNGDQQIRGGRGRRENTEIFQVASVTGGEEPSLPAICMFLFLLCIAPIYACVCRIFKIQVRNTVRNSSTASLAPSISTNEERQIRIERHHYRLCCQ